MGGRGYVIPPCLPRSILKYSCHAEDRVQWHRAWAEMLRWMEEFELKHTEFLKSINSFQTMSTAWDTLANAEEDPARAAFARHRSNAYVTLHDHAVNLFTRTAEARFVDPDGGSIVEALRTFRKTELAWLQELVNDESPSGDYSLLNDDSPVLIRFH
jgi:hypothetical protein